MASSDRTQLKQAIVGSIGDSRTVTNAFLVVAQEAQRYVVVNVPAGFAANTAANITLARYDRPVLVKEVRILPDATSNIATNPGNTTFNIGYTNDNGSVLTSLALMNNNTAANGGTGNLVQFVSQPITLFTATTANANLNQTANMIVPSGSHLVLQLGVTAPSVAIGAVGFQVIWEEV